MPSSRVVLLKGVSDVGFIFFTNYTSIKADNISKNSNVALNFFWPYFERQIRIQGVASKLSDQESDFLTPLLLDALEQNVFYDQSATEKMLQQELLL